MNQFVFEITESLHRNDVLINHAWKGSRGQGGAVTLVGIRSRAIQSFDPRVSSFFASSPVSLSHVSSSRSPSLSPSLPLSLFLSPVSCRRSCVRHAARHGASRDISRHTATQPRSSLTRWLNIGPAPSLLQCYADQAVQQALNEDIVQNRCNQSACCLSGCRTKASDMPC